MAYDIQGSQTPQHSTPSSHPSLQSKPDSLYTALHERVFQVRLQQNIHIPTPPPMPPPRIHTDGIYWRRGDPKKIDLEKQDLATRQKVTSALEYIHKELPEEETNDKPKQNVSVNLDVQLGKNTSSVML